MLLQFVLPSCHLLLQAFISSTSIFHFFIVSMFMVVIYLLMEGSKTSSSLLLVLLIKISLSSPFTDISKFDNLFCFESSDLATTTLSCDAIY